MELYQQIGMYPGLFDRYWSNKMTEGVIAFDLDGVLANFTRGFTGIGSRLFGTPTGDIPSMREWMFEDIPALGLSKEYCALIWDVLKRNPSFWTDLDPINLSVMKRVNAIKNKVFITNRFGIEPQGQSVAFLEKWGIQNPDVIVASKKGPVAAERNVVAIIDDYYPNVTDVKASVPTCFAALLDLPYNQKYHGEWRITGGEIVYSVDHFLDECDRRSLTRYY